MITTWSHGAPEDNMDENILVQLSDIVSRHPWWAVRAEIVLALLIEADISQPLPASAQNHSDDSADAPPRFPEARDPHLPWHRLSPVKRGAS
jgi:hypothetical protein